MEQTTSTPNQTANETNKKNKNTIWWVLGCGGCLTITFFFTALVGLIVYAIWVEDSKDDYDYDDYDYDVTDYNYNDNYNYNTNTNTNTGISYDLTLGITSYDLITGLSNRGYSFDFSQSSQYMGYRYYSAAVDNASFSYGEKDGDLTSVTINLNNYANSEQPLDVALLDSTLKIIDPVFGYTNWITAELANAAQSNKETYLVDYSENGIYYNLTVYTSKIGDTTNQSITLLINPSYE